MLSSSLLTLTCLPISQVFLTPGQLAITMEYASGGETPTPMQTWLPLLAWRLNLTTLHTTRM